MATSSARASLRAPAMMPKATTQAKPRQFIDTMAMKLVSGVGFSNGMGRVGVEEAAAVGADLLDRLLAGDGAQGERLAGAFQRRGVDVLGEGLRHALHDQGHGHQRAEKGRST